METGDITTNHIEGDLPDEMPINLSDKMTEDEYYNEEGE